MRGVVIADRQRTDYRTEMAYGDGDASYRAAGQEEGIRRLARAFYREMSTWPGAQRIAKMHPPNLALSEEKLAVFLCGWLGGPKNYAERFGQIRIPRAHAHLDIDGADRDAWLHCMQKAVDDQPWADDFKAYFMGAIRVPAERVVVVCGQERAARAATREEK